LIDAEHSAKQVQAKLSELHNVGFDELQNEGFKRREIESIDFVDLRYRGQSYELTVKLEPNFLDRFHKAHEKRYGYANRGRSVELVNVRTTFFGRTAKPQFRKATKQRGRPSAVNRQPVWIGGKRVKTAIYDRATLNFGHVINGPAIIGEYSSTTLVPQDFRCSVDAYRNLVLERHANRSRST
jgi:N-methylhydantoinase A